MTQLNVPDGYATVNPFIITRDADGLIRFLTDVFGGIDHPDARTMDHDGLLLHAELQIGDTTVMFAERKPGWPYTPALLQVYVDDVQATLERAERGGAEVITRPTDFFGFHVFSRFLDPWRNLWWVYSASAATEGGEDDSTWDDAPTDYDRADDAGDESAAEDWQPTPELSYIHDTLLGALPRLQDPYAGADTRSASMLSA